MFKKLHVSPITLLAGLALLLLPAAASADWQGRIEIFVPFEFMVGDDELPAGTYHLSTMEVESNVLKIMSADGEHEMTTITVPYAGDPDEGGNPKLVFEQYDGDHYLARVMLPTHSMAWNIQVPDSVDAHVEEGKSMKTSVEGREG